jgi:hypothetical protein
MSEEKMLQNQRPHFHGIDYSNDAMAATKLLAETIKNIVGVLKEPVADAYILSLAPQYVEVMAFFWVGVFNKSSNQNI